MGLWIVIIKFWQPGPRLTRLSLSGWDLRVETRDRLPPLCRGRLLTFNLIFVPGTVPTSGAPEHPVLGDNWWIPVEIIFRRSPPLPILFSSPSSLCGNRIGCPWTICKARAILNTQSWPYKYREKEKVRSDQVRTNSSSPNLRSTIMSSSNSEHWPFSF